MTKEERVIFTDAIQTFGKNAQIVVAIEEMAELTKALTKKLRGSQNLNSIIEEIADVEIMLDQLKLMSCVFSSVKNERDFKVQRLAERIKEVRP